MEVILVRQPYSWAEPALGSIHLVLPGDNPEAEPLVQQALDGQRSFEFKLSVYNFAWSKYRSLFLHEWAHILQTASYPTLFVRARRTVRQIYGPFVCLRRNPKRQTLPLVFHLERDWVLSEKLETVPVRVILGDDGAKMAVASNRNRRGIISELDLIEEDATVFQYRGEIGAEGNGAGYRRWLREKARYHRVFSILAKRVGDDAAFALIPMLTRMAFRTTRPLSAFFRVFGFVHKVGGDYLTTPARIEEVEAVLLEELLKHFGVADEDSLDPMTPTIRDKPGVITDELFARVIEKTPQLVVQPMAMETLLPVPLKGLIVKVLRRPWIYFPRRSELRDEVLKLVPPAVTVRFDHPEVSFGATVLIVAPALAKIDVPGVGCSYHKLVVDGLRCRHVSNGLTGDPGLSPDCPHRDCPIHRTGLCRGWWPVPGQWENCDFPEFFEGMTGHRVSDDGRELRPIETIPNNQGVCDGPTYPG